MSQAPSTAPPRRAHLLSNGRYTVMVSGSGGGFSRYGDLAVTRWREDPTWQDWGSFLLLHDVASGEVWSAERQLGDSSTDGCTFTTSDDSVHLGRSHAGIVTQLEIRVAADCDVEMRCLQLRNDSGAPREIEVTSYAELVLGSAAGDATHPAFSKMFVQTEALGAGGPLLATRRRRGPEEAELWALHQVTGGTSAMTDATHETDRARFLGRGRALRNALALRSALSMSAGCVLDPIFSVRRRLRLAAGETAQLCFWTGVASTREGTLALSAALSDAEAPARLRAAAQAVAQRVAAQPGRSPGDDGQWAAWCQQLVAPLLYADRAWRAPDAERVGGGGAPALWSRGISGDRPIVLMRVAGSADLEACRQLLRAQSFWRERGLGVDVVLQVADTEVLPALTTMAQRQAAFAAQQLPAAAVFVLDDTTLDAPFRAGLATVARVVLEAGQVGVLQPQRASAAEETGAPVRGNPRPQTHADATFSATDPHPAWPQPGAMAVAEATPSPSEFNNGYGGFINDANEYEILLTGDACTPLPWSNIVANPRFGFIATAEGGGHTFSINSQQNPLTPWPNDPVTDAPREVLYLRDRDSGDCRSATAQPLPLAGVRYRTRHGHGYTRYDHVADDIAVDLLQLVPVEDCIKLSRLCVHNHSGKIRRLSLLAYAQWALGPNGSVPAPYVSTSIDESTGALFASNRWRAEYGQRVAFADLAGAQQSVTGDRAEVLGALGSVAAPLALASDDALSGRVGAGFDPCAALRYDFELGAGESIELRFLLGDADSAAQAQALLIKYRALDIDAVLAQVQAQWTEVLGAVQVRTPDRAMDVMLNGWLLYQTLACRLWARTAYYQSSGAFGFRDQLQDVLALCVARPDLTRQQLLHAAARQFVEGDVQHWWLPPAGQGIRTRMTDDRAWLPYVALHYLQVTGDQALLDEDIIFIEGPALAPEAHEAFGQPQTSSQHASFYEHCARALDISLALGAHSLPLMGTGDWNDGMNRVGAQGRGESTWLAWFLADTMRRFAPVAQARGDAVRAERWLTFVDTVAKACDSSAWDGQWYRRGYYDDGAPLGSDADEECKIDAIAQSWSVLSGVADPAHSRQAMHSLDARLIDRQARVAMLFTPPFNHSAHDPGYIKGYPPGIRENGGQYTHGSLWSVFAWAQLGDGDRAFELFDILSPVRHADTAQGVARYKVEPYVSCADVYSVAPMVGRGGWTWYSGSAGWLYRAGLEAVLGFHVQGETARMNPCIPKQWPGFELSYRHGRSTYRIVVGNLSQVCGGVATLVVDGQRQEVPASGGCIFALIDDGAEHRVLVELGAKK